MTEPAPTDQGDQGKQQQGRRGSAAAEGVGAVPAVLTVGHFTHRDPIFGTVHERPGIVVEVGEKLTVAPLDHHRYQVDPGDFTPITPDDLSS